MDISLKNNRFALLAIEDNALEESKGDKEKKPAFDSEPEFEFGAFKKKLLKSPINTITSLKETILSVDLKNAYWILITIIEEIDLLFLTDNTQDLEDACFKLFDIYSNILRYALAEHLDNYFEYKYNTFGCIYGLSDQEIIDGPTKTAEKIFSILKDLSKDEHIETKQEAIRGILYIDTYINNADHITELYKTLFDNCDSIRNIWERITSSLSDAKLQKLERAKILLDLIKGMAVPNDQKQFLDYSSTVVKIAEIYKNSDLDSSNKLVKDIGHKLKIISQTAKEKFAAEYKEAYLEKAENRAQDLVYKAIKTGTNKAFRDSFHSAKKVILNQEELAKAEHDLDQNCLSRIEEIEIQFEAQERTSLEGKILKFYNDNPGLDIKHHSLYYRKDLKCVTKSTKSYTEQRKFEINVAYPISEILRKIDTAIASLFPVYEDFTTHQEEEVALIGGELFFLTPPDC